MLIGKHSDLELLSNNKRGYSVRLRWYINSWIISEKDVQQLKNLWYIEKEIVDAIENDKVIKLFKKPKEKIIKVTCNNLKDTL